MEYGHNVCHTSDVVLTKVLKKILYQRLNDNSLFDLTFKVLSPCMIIRHGTTRKCDGCFETLLIICYHRTTRGACLCMYREMLKIDI